MDVKEKWRIILINLMSMNIIAHCFERVYSLELDALFYYKFIRWEGEVMAGYENIKDHGFDKRTAEERRELAIKAGRASGEARRRKVDFRRDINLLLTTLLPDGDISDQMRAMGLEPTVGMAMHMKMAVEVLKNGDVKAYEALAKYAGQSSHTEADEKEQAAKTEQMKAQVDKLNRDGQDEDGEDGVEIVNDAPKEEN